MDNLGMQVAIWVAMAALGSAIGQSKGRPVYGFLCGFLLGPLGLLLVAVAQSVAICVHCRSNMHPEARVCAKCGNSK